MCIKNLLQWSPTSFASTAMARISNLFKYPLLLVCFIFLIGLILLEAHVPQEKKELKFLHKKTATLKFKSTRTVILIWTQCDQTQGKLLRTFKDCPNCIVTWNRSYLNQSSAVIFCIEWFKWSDIPSPNSRRSDQYYVFYTLEPPPIIDKISRIPLSVHKDFFNLTITYRLDSDIFYPYGKFLTRKLDDQNLISDHDLLNIIQGKTKQVAWFVTNCRTPSGRERFVGFLRSYINVDIFGHCGRLICAPNSKDCYEMLTEKYKFYLSLENSVCRDYMTEKFYGILEKSLIIPIVMERKIILDTIPDRNMARVINGSFIAASDFGHSAKKLAKYLEYLDSNNTAYMEYFQWRAEYKVVSDYRLIKPGCRLCKLIKKKKPRMINDIDNWYNKKSLCYRRKRFW